MNDFSKNLNNIIHNLELSQKETAEKIGISVNTLSNILNERFLPSDETKFLIYLVRIHATTESMIFCLHFHRGAKKGVMPTEKINEVFGQIDLIKDVADEIMTLSETTQNSINTISQQAKISAEAAGKNLEMSGKVFEIIENFKV